MAAPLDGIPTTRLGPDDDTNNGPLIVKLLTDTVVSGPRLAAVGNVTANDTCHLAGVQVAMSKALRDAFAASPLWSEHVPLPFDTRVAAPLVKLVSPPDTSLVVERSASPPLTVPSCVPISTTIAVCRSRSGYIAVTKVESPVPSSTAKPTACHVCVPAPVVTVTDDSVPP